MYSIAYWSDKHYLQYEIMAAAHLLVPSSKYGLLMRTVLAVHIPFLSQLCS